LVLTDVVMPKMGGVQLIDGSKKGEKILGVI
jgi:YesN/AraC family two-component response regulator